MAEINVQKAPRADDRRLPIFAEAEQMMQRIRERAFAAFGRRGFAEGGALNDWLAAERKLCWPAAELVEQDKNYTLNVGMAGFEPKDISVTATPRELIVSAKKEATRSDKTAEKSEQVCWSEFRSNDVYRRVGTLPFCDPYSPPDIIRLSTPDVCGYEAGPCASANAPSLIEPARILE